MSSPEKVIKKATKRSSSQKKTAESSQSGPSAVPKSSETSPMTTRSSKGESSESVSRTAKAITARRRVDFSKLDIRALAASVAGDSKVCAVGALTKTITENRDVGKTKGSVSVSLQVLATRVRSTKGGSRYILFVDETGFVSLCVSAKQATALNEDDEVVSKESAERNAIVICIDGKVNYQPSSSNEEESFIALDWNAKLTVSSIQLDNITNLCIPTSMRGILHTISDNQNSGALFHVLLADLVTVEVDHAKKEITMSLMDCTGYAIVVIHNATSNVREGAEDSESTGPVVIAGSLSFTALESGIMEGIATSVDYKKYVIKPVARSIMDKHNKRIKAIVNESFQFSEPFLED